MAITQLRLAVTTDDYDAAVRFYRDVLGMTEQDAVSSPDGRVAILDAGRATLEIIDPAQAAYIDQVEVGRRVAGQVRVALGTDTLSDTFSEASAGGADVLAEPRPAPWGFAVARVEGPAGLQLGLFEDPAAEKDAGTGP